MDFDPSVPIWLQLVDEFRRRIVTGEWPRGERISGVRELAGDLRVNPNTVQRALAELDRLGLTRSERTAGRFATDDGAVIDAARVEQNPLKQLELWKTAQKKIIEDVCAVPLQEQLQSWARKKDVDYGYKFEAALRLGPEVTELTNKK